MGITWYNPLTPKITINGGNVTANGSACGAAIGGGGGCFIQSKVPPTEGADLTINSGNVTINGWIGGGKDYHDGINHWADDGKITDPNKILAAGGYTDNRPPKKAHGDSGGGDPVDPDNPGGTNPPVDPDAPGTGNTTDPDLDKLFGGGGLILHIGEGVEDYDFLSVYIEDMRADALGLTGTNIRTQENATAALKACKSAINYVSESRGDLGAYQNRLEHTINNLGVMVENTTDAESAIRDTDMAEEMMAYTKENIINQAAQSMLAQANQVPQGILQLLQ